MPQDHLELEYAYTVDGVEYTGRGYSLMRVFANWFEPPHRIAQRFPVGSQVEIRYAPTRHDVSTIRAGLALYDVLLAVLATVLLLLALVAPLRELRRRRRNADSQESTG